MLKYEIINFKTLDKFRIRYRNFYFYFCSKFDRKIMAFKM